MISGVKRRSILIGLRTTVFAVSSFPAATALPLHAGDAVVVVADPASLAFEAGDLPRGFALASGGSSRDEAVDRLAAAIGDAAKNDPSLEIAIATQDLRGPSGPSAVIAVAVRRGDARAFADSVARLRADRYDSRRFGNVVLVFATDDRSQRTVLAGAAFGRYARLARAAAETRAAAGDAGGALACLETILEFSPDDARARVRAGEIASSHEPSRASAREHFERGLRSLEKAKPAARPKGLLLDARIGLARLDRESGDAAAAESALRRAAIENGVEEKAVAARVGYELAAAIAADPKRAKEALDTLERALDDESKSGSPENALARRAAADKAFGNVAGDDRFDEILRKFGAGRRP